MEPARDRDGVVQEVGGLQLGDIVQRIGTTNIANIADSRAAMDTVAKTKPPEVVFFIFRDNKTMFVNLKTN